MRSTFLRIPQIKRFGTFPITITRTSKIENFLKIISLTRGNFSAQEENVPCDNITLNPGMQNLHAHYPRENFRKGSTPAAEGEFKKKKVFLKYDELISDGNSPKRKQ